MGAGVLLLALSGIGMLRPVEDASYTVLSPMEAGLRSLAEPVADVVSTYGDVRDLTQENESLRGENERLNADLARLREESARREELERLLDTRNALASLDPIAARVIARDPSNLRHLVAINRGRSHGLRVGMPVVTEGSTLVGTITKVENDHAWVALVTDVDSAVSAVLVESRAAGVVAGGYDRRLSMEFVDQNAAVKEGDTVITSGLGGTYPDGLVVGKVTAVSGSRQELFRRVTVEPLTSLARLESVLVLVGFAPLELSRP
jgi:rod shape-determining protein MreC